ncbi:MAG: hypothetical protein ACIARR_00890, partial [Phycisphaerales bacterium JB059]
GFQFHFELDRPGIDRLAGAESELLDRAGVNQSQISVEAEEHYERFGLIADRLCVNLASFAFPFSELLSV